MTNPSPRFPPGYMAGTGLRVLCRSMGCRDLVGVILSASGQAQEAYKAQIAAEKERDAAIEDRARFPDRPDMIGNMIAANIANQKTKVETADKSARKAYAMRDQLIRENARIVAERDRLREALANAFGVVTIELNPSNYSHDDACLLDNQMCEAMAIINAALNWEDG